MTIDAPNTRDARTGGKLGPSSNSAISKMTCVPVSLALAPSSAPDSALSELRAITDRQLQCLAWVQQGKSASDIGGILGISSRTVEGHLSKICAHLNVRTRFQAVLRALDLGLLTREP